MYQAKLDTERASSGVSAVVCSWNSSQSIVACLRSLRDNEVKEIILVDAGSEDGTREMAAPYVDLILTDPRKGLGYARNMGIYKTTGAYILNCGSDNIMPPGSIEAMLHYKISGGFSGVGAVTVLKRPGYWGWAMNLYKRARYYPGERSVIGTPTLFDGDQLRKYPYDKNRQFSDDAELCERWKATFNSTFAISEVLVEESGQANWNSICYRWRIYGKSDFEIYSSHRHAWSFTRKVQSIQYPLMEEVVKPFIRTTGVKRLGLIPFLLIITMLRYRAWLHYELLDRRGTS